MTTACAKKNAVECTETGEEVVVTSPGGARGWCVRAYQIVITLDVDQMIGDMGSAELLVNMIVRPPGEINKKKNMIYE